MTNSILREQTESTPATATPTVRVAKRRADAASPKTKPSRKATGAKKAASARRGSKKAKILELLKRSGGVTLKELVKATGWQAHSVRGFLSGAIGKKMGTPVTSSERFGGEWAYHLSSK